MKVRACFYGKSLESYEPVFNAKLHILSDNQESTECGKDFSYSGRWVVDSMCDIEKITCTKCKKIKETTENESS